jgi:hypothetical protein
MKNNIFYLFEKRRVLIHEEAEYVKMMSTGFFGAKPESKRPSDNNKDAKSAVVLEPHQRHLKMSTEIITSYKKGIVKFWFWIIFINAFEKKFKL